MTFELKTENREDETVSVCWCWQIKTKLPTDHGLFPFPFEHSILSNTLRIKNYQNYLPYFVELTNQFTKKWEKKKRKSTKETDHLTEDTVTKNQRSIRGKTRHLKLPTSCTSFETTWLSFINNIIFWCLQYIFFPDELHPCSLRHTHTSLAPTPKSVFIGASLVESGTGFELGICRYIVHVLLQLIFLVKRQGWPLIANYFHSHFNMVN